ncbi:hypothetical protein LTR36_006594 [Oleoguttula mirabilis]|uniref:Uncharacterized protein n=1 Tax=Oleoguttula mirabilis TaxID=1507867 RepID=A0AAV9JBZ5_9PEZI|nr:hypothetical protein LTR36_006594 [Oleoguttula mirabilis]
MAESLPSPSVLSPSTPAPLFQPSFEPDVPPMQAFAADYEDPQVGIIRSATAPLFPSTSGTPLSLLDQRLQELQGFIPLLWHQVDRPSNSSFEILRGHFKASISHLITSNASCEDSDLQTRVRILENHVRQLWGHLTTPIPLDGSGLWTLRMLGSALLPGAVNVPACPPSVPMDPADIMTPARPLQAQPSLTNTLDGDFLPEADERAEALDDSNSNAAAFAFTDAQYANGFVDPQQLFRPLDGPSTQMLPPSYMPMTQHDSAEALRWRVQQGGLTALQRGQRYPPKSRQQRDSAYDTGEDEFGARDLAGGQLQ